jgi:hypothetical protein
LTARSLISILIENAPPQAAGHFAGKLCDLNFDSLAVAGSIIYRFPILNSVVLSTKGRSMLMMTLKTYFEENKGTGVLATADSNGKVDAAIYSRPHFMQDGTLAFIMRDRLTHHNLQSNPHALFLFIEQGPGHNGKRLFLKKAREENNPELIQKIKRRQYSDDNEAPKFLVYFTLEKELPLIGGGDA